MPKTSSPAFAWLTVQVERALADELKAQARAADRSLAGHCWHLLKLGTAVEHDRDNAAA